MISNIICALHALRMAVTGLHRHDKRAEDSAPLERMHEAPSLYWREATPALGEYNKQVIFHFSPPTPHP